MVSARESDSRSESKVYVICARRAFSLIELLVVIAIVATLSAIGLPVVAAAKRQAKTAASIQQIRQIHLGLMLYRSDHDGDGVYGSAADMGLPFNTEYGPSFERAKAYVPYDLWRSPCGTHPSMGVQVEYPIEYFAYDDPPEFAQWAREYQENLILVFDMQCSKPESDLDNPRLTKLGLGVLLSGSSRKLLKPGAFRQPSWWSNPPEETE